MFQWLTTRVKMKLNRYEPAVFLHIQKTAGTSLIHVAGRHYTDTMSHGDFVGRPPESLNNFQFISGHFGYDYARQLISERKSLTFLREPEERIVSLYYFCRVQNPDEFPIYRIAHESSFAEFLRLGFTDRHVKSHIWNNQTWQLAKGWGNSDNSIIDDFSPQELLEDAKAHLKNFTFVGLTENFHEDAGIVARLLRWELTDNLLKTKKNVGQGRPLATDISVEERSLLAALTELDKKLYEYVKMELRASPPLSALHHQL